jgi:hypothetical protein
VKDETEQFLFLLDGQQISEYSKEQNPGCLIAMEITVGQ